MRRPQPRRQRDRHAVRGLRGWCPVEADVPVSQRNPDRPVLGVSGDDRVLIGSESLAELGMESGRDLRARAVRDPSGAGLSGRGREAGCSFAESPPVSCTRSARASTSARGDGSAVEARLREVKPLGGRRQVVRSVLASSPRRPPGQGLSPEDEHVADILAELRPVIRREIRDQWSSEPGWVVEYPVSLGDLAAVHQPFFGQGRVHEWWRQEPNRLPALIPQPAVGRVRLDPLKMPVAEEE